MTDRPDCHNCGAPFDKHMEHMDSAYRFRCPSAAVWKTRGVYSGLYWPQNPDGTRAASWEPHPVLSPLEQVLVNNIETIREVLDDWFALNDADEITPSVADLIERAHTLRREIAELSGELES